MIKDITGQIFGKLKVLNFDKFIKGNAYWICQCECGIKKSFNGGNLKSKRSKSCGCRTGGWNTGKRYHGYTGTRTYKSWSKMKERCYNKNNNRYELYGGREITVCDTWHTFTNFLQDMGERPEGTSIDRIDSNGNYEPGNCRWSTISTQNSNRRSWKKLS
jgi:hypothetical protein